MKWSRSILLTMISGSLLLTSCGGEREAYDTMETPTSSVDFRQWCREQKLQKCDTALDPSVSLPQWQASIGILRELVNSASQIQVTRRDLELVSVQNLVASLGLESSLGLFRRIPWQTLEAGRGTMSLTPLAPGATLEYNGLTLIATSNIVASWQQRTLRIKGLSLKTAQTSPTEVQAIVFDDPNRLQLVLANQTITNLPISFLSEGPSSSAGGLSPFLLLSRFGELGLDSAFNWRAKVRISVLGTNLSALVQELERLIAAGQDQTIQPFFATLRTNGKALTGGGAGDLVVNQSVQTPFGCSLRVLGVPVLGSVDATIDFGPGFGLSKLTRLNKQRTKVDVYGVKTNFGDVRTIEMEGQRLWIKVGSLTIPLDGRNQSNGSFENVRCAVKG